MQYYGVNDYKINPTNKNTKIGCVYVLKFENCVKIGRTTKIKERIIQYDPKPQDLFYTDNFDTHCDVERTILKTFKPFKIKGEWFNVSFETAINELKKVTQNQKKFTKPDTNIKIEKTKTPSLKTQLKKQLKEKGETLGDFAERNKLKYDCVIAWSKAARKAAVKEINKDKTK